MWQRIQSLYLLLFAACTAIFAFARLPFGTLSGNGDQVMEAAVGTAFADGKFSADDHVILVFLLILGTLLAAGTIFFYKNRILQSRLSSGLIFLCLIVSMLAFYLIYNDLNQIRALTIADFNPGIGAAFPMIGIILAFLAKRAIDKDEKLVRSMDRLR
jgi:hypothetical protein